MEIDCRDCGRGITERQSLFQEKMDPGMESMSRESIKESMALGTSLISSLIQAVCGLSVRSTAEPCGLIGLVCDDICRSSAGCWWVLVRHRLCYDGSTGDGTWAWAMLVVWAVFRAAVFLLKHTNTKWPVRIGGKF